MPRSNLLNRPVLSNIEKLLIIEHFLLTRHRLSSSVYTTAWKIIFRPSLFPHLLWRTARRQIFQTDNLYVALKKNVNAEARLWVSTTIMPIRQVGQFFVWHKVPPLSKRLTSFFFARRRPWHGRQRLSDQASDKSDHFSCAPKRRPSAGYRPFG